MQEKGFDTAIAAAAGAGVPLVIAGDGPTRHACGRWPGVTPGRCASLGAWLRMSSVRLRAGAAVVLAPSRWEEPCPYSVLDALAAGVPVLAADRGGLPEIVGPDGVVAAEDTAAWTAALSALWSDPGLRAERGRASLERARSRHDEERFLERLMRIYVS